MAESRKKSVAAMLGFVAHGTNYLSALKNLTLYQSFARIFNNFMISSVPIFNCKTLFNYFYDKFCANLLSSLSYFYNEVRVFF